MGIFLLVLSISGTCFFFTMDHTIKKKTKKSDPLALTSYLDNSKKKKLKKCLPDTEAYVFFIMLLILNYLMLAFYLLLIISCFDV